jgi:hypothetical protein
MNTAEKAGLLFGTGIMGRFIGISYGLSNEFLIAGIFLLVVALLEAYEKVD